MASVGSILSGAFRLFREQPVTVSIWAALFIAYTVCSSALMLSGWMFDAQALQAGTISPVTAIGLGLGFGIFALLFMAVLSCAVYRAILRPEEGGFAYLRFGSDEFRMAGLYLLVGLVGGFVVLIFGLGAFFLMGGAALAGGGGAGGIGIGLIFVLALFLAGIYIFTRLSLIFPATFLRRQMAIDEGWGLSRGRFWTLFLAFLVIWVILIAVQLFAPAIPGQPDFFSTIRAMQTGGVEAMEAQQLNAAATLSLVSLLPYLLISAVVQLFSHVVGNSATATAVREFLRDDGEVLEDDIERTAQIFE